MIFDINKPYRTRDGREAWATLSPEDFFSKTTNRPARLIGWINNCGLRIAHAWTIEGLSTLEQTMQCFEQNSSDLVNAPKKLTLKVWFNVNGTSEDNIWLSPVIHDTRLAADSNDARSQVRTVRRIACIEREITFETGEGLESSP